MTATAMEICERLAILGRAGYPVRGALIRLPARMSHPHDGVLSAARRARLGYPISRCLEPLEPLLDVGFIRFSRCLGPTASTGVDWAHELDEVASSLRDRALRCRAAANSGAGATLSARTIALLPLLMLPVAVKQLADPVVAVSVVLGLVLGYVGYRWLIKIVPSAPIDDPVADLAGEVAASLSSGISLDRALRDAASRRPDLSGMVRKVDLGARWVDVVPRYLPEIGAALGDAVATGTPIVTSLRRSAEQITRERTQAFERQVERAPIRMVVPLVCCILPSFIMVAIVPLLKGLAQPA